jgi:hypothetical protein
VTWPLPELDVGVEVGELRPDDELFDVPEPEDVPELDAACRVLPDAEPADVIEPVAAPGRANATPAAAIRLAAAAVTVAARSRARPRSLAAPDGMLCLRWVMTASVTGRSRQRLWASSQPPMSDPPGSPRALTR